MSLSGNINRLGRFFGSRGGTMGSGAGRLPGMNTGLLLGQNVMVGKHTGWYQCTNCLHMYESVEDLRAHIKAVADGSDACTPAEAGRVVNE